MKYMGLTSLVLGMWVNAAVQAEGAAHWGYTGHHGPEHWGHMSDDFKLCSMGKNQSPIDISASMDTQLAAIEFKYTAKPTSILNNGHTLQVNMAEGSSIIIEGQSYALKQFHFHTPSENHISGQSFPLEAHFVHADAQGNLAVVGVMFAQGDENADLAKFWSLLPEKEGETVNLTAQTAEDVVALLPKTADYYRFNGSLTTPPCSEGVRWMVMATPVTISAQQVEHFAHLVHGANNRPVQPVNARVIVK